MSTEKKLIGTTILTAIAASLCCITPVLALIAGTSGFASTFSWLDPFRPYLIAFTILVIGFAWYQKLKPKKQDLDCECEDEKTSFLNSKKFLLMVTIFAGFMLAFPYYSSVFYPKTNKEAVYVSNANAKELRFHIGGMTCAACEIHIESEVNKLQGIVVVKADYENAITTVTYDKIKVEVKDIEAAILKTGYRIIE